MEATPRRIRAADVACVGGLLAGIVAGYLLLAVTPVLLARHPVTLEMLAGSTPALATAGVFARVGRLSLVVALAAPLVCVASYDVFYWWAGRRYGDQVIAAYTRRRSRSAPGVATAMRWAGRWGPWVLAVQYYLPVPNNVLQAATGAAGVPLWQFVAADALGSLLWAALVVGLGYGIGRPAVHVVDEVSHYGLWVTAGIVVVVIGASALRARRQQGAGDDSPVRP